MGAERRRRGAGRGLIVVDLRTRTIKRVDTDLARMFGHQAGALAGQPIETVVAPEERDEVGQRLRQIEESGQVTFESIAIRKDASTLPVRVSAMALLDEPRGIAWAMALVEDLTGITQVATVREPRGKYAAGSPAAAYRLTGREVEVLRLVAAGKTDKEIAQQLGRSAYTVHNHVRHILLKMSAKSRTDATVRALKEGLV